MRFVILVTVIANDADVWDLRSCSLVLICGRSGKIFLPSLRAQWWHFTPKMEITPLCEIWWVYTRLLGISSKTKVYSTLLVTTIAFLLSADTHAYSHTHSDNIVKGVERVTLM